ncbi:MAG: hypothetical protein JXR27_05505 [Paludibacteraceae bacterium]|nr:hypothetical protein [Paludibacteraceae bacterium]
MRKTINNIYLTICILFITVASLSAQINTEDSTVQVIGYWDMNEKQSYLIHDRRISIENSDTTSMQEFQYKVDIQIKDSTDSSYVIEWKYYAYSFVSGSDELKKIMAVYQPVKVLIRTDEMGMFSEVINHEELSVQMNKRLKVLMQKYKSDNYISAQFVKLADKYSSKQSIEQLALAEIQQFYSFHGGMYKLGENVNASLKTPFPGTFEIDTEINIWLSEIDVEDNNFIVQMNKLLNEEQMRNVVYEQLKNNPSLSPEEIPALEDVPAVKVETWSASRIHNAGWPIYSVQTVEVTAENESNIEERIIELL